MRDFDTILVPTTDQTVTQTLVSEPVPTVTEQVTVIRASETTSYLAKAPALWNWTDLRDYLMCEIEQRHGPQVHDSLREAGILKAFISRWGIEKAVAIARASMEVHDGMWHNAPITITRYCKASDPYFAAVIAVNV
jgi:hypothetical protein